MNDQLFLCFFGDSALWDNMVTIPAYPSGYSYHRPFRYREKWINGDVLQEVSTADGRSVLFNQEVNICMRFIQQDHQWRIVPIRKANITHIEYLPGQQSFYFKLGPLFDYNQYKDKDLLSISLELDPLQYDHSLVFRSDILANSSISNKDQETSNWVIYSDLVASEKSLPVKEEGKNAVFLRFNILDKTKDIDPTDIYSSPKLGKISGAALSEGSHYEIIVYHRIPGLFDKHDSIKTTRVNYLNNTKNIEFSRGEEDFTSNYQEHVTIVSALKPSGTWEQILVSTKDGITQSQKGIEINFISLTIPIKVRINYIYRFKNLWVWLLLFWVSLFSTVYVQNLLGDKPDPVFVIILAALTLLSSLAIFILQQKGVSVSK